MKKLFFLKHRCIKRSIQGGFTIVETLVAITILMIAIAGPLVVATKGLNTATYSKNQMIASYLAQEGMEVIKSIRYNNMVNGDDWLGSFTECDNSVKNACDASAFAPYIISGCMQDFNDIKGCPILYDDATGYSQSGTGPVTFYRYFHIEDVANETLGEKTAHVFVEWKEGRVPYQIHIVSEITNAQR